jgi:hypothetical protein
MRQEILSRLYQGSATLPIILRLQKVIQRSWKMLYVLDLLAMALFAIPYYRNCYRKGYRIDFWHAQLFLVCVLPNMLMLPFAASEPNALVLGRERIEEVL